MNKLQHKKSFSLFEVLVALAVISILSSLIFSASRDMRESGKRTTCLNNLKQIQTVAEAYKKDHRTAPYTASLGDLSFAQEYISESDLDIFVCPSDDDASVSSFSDLVGGGSYYYIPTEDMANEMTGMEEALDHYMVIYDKHKDAHGKSFNIVYLHAKSNDKAGVAETYKGYDDSDDHVALSNEGSEEELTVDNVNIPFEEKEKNNNGHGNNEDGIDSSNKNADKKADKEGVEDSTDSDGNVVDDEKKTGGNK